MGTTGRDRRQRREDAGKFLGSKYKGCVKRKRKNEKHKSGRVGLPNIDYPHYTIFRIMETPRIVCNPAEPSSSLQHPYAEFSPTPIAQPPSCHGNCEQGYRGLVAVQVRGYIRKTRISPGAG